NRDETQARELIETMAQTESELKMTGVLRRKLEF
ncbi:hypothetical protein A2U01_0100843, partial [Trifolium medium]|nr:hypothetical protein [Trifolium medium]